MSFHKVIFCTDSSFLAFSGKKSFSVFSRNLAWVTFLIDLEHSYILEYLFRPILQSIRLKSNFPKI